MRALEGALLDVDGTLVDSNDAHTRAWVRALAEADVEVPFERVRRLIGKDGDKLLSEVSDIDPDSPRGKQITRRRSEIFMREYLPKLRPFRGAMQLLARMRADGLRLAVASSSKKDELAALLHVCGADVVDAETSSEDADSSRPDPDVVRAALARLGVPPARALLLADTPYDVEAGGRAGVGVVALRSGGWSDADLAGAVAVYDNPSDLLVHYEESPFALPAE